MLNKFQKLQIMKNLTPKQEFLLSIIPLAGVFYFLYFFFYRGPQNSWWNSYEGFTAYLAVVFMHIIYSATIIDWVKHL